MDQDFKKKITILSLIAIILFVIFLITKKSTKKEEVQSIQQTSTTTQPVSTTTQETFSTSSATSNFTELIRQQAEKSDQWMKETGFLFSTSTDVQIKGVVEVKNLPDSKLVINYAENYQIEIPKDFLLTEITTTTVLSFTSKDYIENRMPRDWGQIIVFVFDKKIFDELSRLRSKDIIKKTEKIIINGVEFTKVWYKKVEEDEPEDMGSYFTIKNGKVYEISVYSIKDYEKYVKTFKFLK